MTTVGALEIQTQRRVIAHFRDHLGYTFLGNWHERDNNRNIETELLTRFLARQDHTPTLITKALNKLDKAAALGGSKTLYDANREVYSLLRYGARVSPGVGKHTVTVHLIDWKNPAANHFAIAEEVTVTGKNNKRPDIVLYVQWDRHRRAGTQALDRLGGTGDPPEPGQPAEGVHPAVLQHRAARHGGQRHRGAALRRDRDAREVLAPLEGSQCPRRRRLHLPPPRRTRPPLRPRPPARTHPRLRGLRRRRQEDLPAQPVLRGEGGPEARRPARRRDHLAHPGQREEPHDGVAGEVDP